MRVEHFIDDYGYETTRIWHERVDAYVDVWEMRMTHPGMFKITVFLFGKTYPSWEGANKYNNKFEALEVAMTELDKIATG